MSVLMTSFSDGLSTGSVTVGLVSNAPVTVGAGPSPMSNEGDGVAEVVALPLAEAEVVADPDGEALVPPPLEEPPQAVRTRATGTRPSSRGRRRADGRRCTGTLRVVAVGRDHPRPHGVHQR